MPINCLKANMLYEILLFSASNGVVLATEKKQKSILYDEQSVHKVEPITKHIGMVYSGMGPDYRFVIYLYTEISLNEVYVFQGPFYRLGI